MQNSDGKIAYRHDISEEEVEAVLVRPGGDRPGRDGARVAIRVLRG